MSGENLTLRAADSICAASDSRERNRQGAGVPRVHELGRASAIASAPAGKWS